jgi:hypothetical protein
MSLQRSAWFINSKTARLGIAFSVYESDKHDDSHISMEILLKVLGPTQAISGRFIEFIVP